MIQVGTTESETQIGGAVKMKLEIVLLFGAFLIFDGFLSKVDAIRRISPYNPKSQTDLSGKVDYKTFYFKQQVDHFGFDNTDTYEQRYLLADQFWDNNGGPIFFYTGNEGDITWFCNNTGFVWDIAPEFKALVIFAEHRYYGLSMPYGSQSFKDAYHLNFLTSEQALADFGSLITHLKSSIPGASKSPVVAFGGSYGGMLAAWFRLKYPSSVVGSLAASAPIFLFSELTNCETYLSTVTKPYTQASPTCADNIRNSWAVINKMGTTDAGLKTMTGIFKLCKPLLNTTDVGMLKSWLGETWGNLAMVNYPYPASFLEPLPGWPIKKACTYLSTPLSGPALLEGVYMAVNLYYNYTGRTNCLDINQEATGSLGDKGWGYQACTEMVEAICSDGKSDMFEPAPWNFTSFAAGCSASWHFPVTPRPHWGPLVYWGKDLEAASNIIFSNGLLDPWSTSGVLKSVSPSVVAIVIPDGAHHLDLRSSNPADPPDVLKARSQEKKIIQGWISDYWSNFKK